MSIDFTWTRKDCKVTPAGVATTMVFGCYAKDNVTGNTATYESSVTLPSSTLFSSITTNMVESNRATITAECRNRLTNIIETLNENSKVKDLP